MQPPRNPHQPISIEQLRSKPTREDIYRINMTPYSYNITSRPVEDILYECETFVGTDERILPNRPLVISTPRNGTSQIFCKIIGALVKNPNIRKLCIQGDRTSYDPDNVRSFHLQWDDLISILRHNNTLEELHLQYVGMPFDINTRDLEYTKLKLFKFTYCVRCKYYSFKHYIDRTHTYDLESFKWKMFGQGTSDQSWDDVLPTCTIS